MPSGRRHGRPARSGRHRRLPHADDDLLPVDQHPGQVEGAQVDARPLPAGGLQRVDHPGTGVEHDDARAAYLPGHVDRDRVSRVRRAVRTRIGARSRRRPTAAPTTVGARRRRDRCGLVTARPTRQSARHRAATIDGDHGELGRTQARQAGHPRGGHRQPAPSRVPARSRHAPAAPRSAHPGWAPGAARPATARLACSRHRRRPRGGTPTGVRSRRGQRPAARADGKRRHPLGARQLGAGRSTGAAHDGTLFRRHPRPLLSAGRRPVDGRRDACRLWTVRVRRTRSEQRIERRDTDREHARAHVRALTPCRWS